jgi:hypothetical protein
MGPLLFGLVQPRKRLGEVAVAGLIVHVGDSR